MFLHKVLKRKRRIFQGNPSVVGLTFLEIIISLTLISVGMVLYLEIFNTAMDAHSRSIREIISINLAQGLMAEIMAKNFEEPGSDPENPPALGPDGTESDRSNFDDVDDFIGYAETPPHTVLGADMDAPDYSGFTRTVPLLTGDPPLPGVIYVDCEATCLPAAAGITTNYKQVTLQVTDPRGRFTELVGIKVRP